jgi:hypothetical protein
MSLQSCPTCGYAVSTTTLKCRHCLASHDEPSASPAGAWFHKNGNKTFAILLMAVSVGLGVYLMLRLQKGGAF